MCYLDTVRGKILEGEKIGEFGELWTIRQFFFANYFRHPLALEPC